MILAPGVRVSGPLFIVSSVHSDLDSLFLDFVFVEISFVYWIFLLTGFFYCGFGAESGVFWRLLQDSAFRCNLKGMVLKTIHTLFGI